MWGKSSIMVEYGLYGVMVWYVFLFLDCIVKSVDKGIDKLLVFWFLGMYEIVFIYR